MFYQVYINGKLTFDDIWESEKAYNFFYKKWFESNFHDIIEVYLIQPIGMSSCQHKIISSIDYKFNKRENVLSLINYLKEINL